MRTSEEIFDDSKLLFHTLLIDQFSEFMLVIEQAQKEAWNESILLSAESATVSFTSDLAGRHYHVSKDSILKNLIL